MAQRKKPEKGPVKDSSEADDTVLQRFVLPERDVARLVKIYRTASAGIIDQILTAAKEHVERLGLNLKRAKPLTADPAEVKLASTQVDVRSFIEWMSRIPKDARIARGQLASLVVLYQGRAG